MTASELVERLVRIEARVIKMGVISKAKAAENILSILESRQIYATRSTIMRLLTKELKQPN